MKKKTWITCAITGGIHTPAMSPYLPVTPQQIIDDAVGAYEAGAAVVHIHAREPKEGRPNPDVNAMKEIVSGIKARCEVVICITTGGALGWMPYGLILSLPRQLLQCEKLAQSMTGRFRISKGPTIWSLPTLLRRWNGIAKP